MPRIRARSMRPADYKFTVDIPYDEGEDGEQEGDGA